MNDASKLKVNQNNSSFFTKKKILSYTIALILFGVIVFLVYKFFFNIEFNQIINSINSSFEHNNLFFLWFFLLLLFPIYNMVLRIAPYWYKLHKRGIRVEWYNWLLFCLITFFIGAITPFAIGSEPYIIYWLNRKGLNTKEATAIVASFTVLNPFIQVLITWPSFFIIASTYQMNTGHVEWVGSFWAVFVGLMFDLIGTVFWFLMSISKRMHFIIGLITNKVKKILKRSYKSNAEIKQEYIKNATFKKLFLAELKDWKFVIIICVGSLFWNIFYYASIILAFHLLDPLFRFNAWDLFNYVNVATTANNFIPIPGAEGTLQATISMFIRYSSNNIITNQDELKIIVDNSVFIWRAFTFYLTTILGLISFIFLLVQEGYKFLIKNKKIKLNIPSKSFTIVLIHSSNIKNLIKSINSILKNQYDKNLVQILIIDTVKKNISKRLLKIISDNNIDYFNCNGKSVFAILQALISKNKIKNEYMNIMESNSLLNFDILDHINNTLATYDSYIGQYRKMKKNQKLTYKKIPFRYWYKKRITNKQQICSPHFELFNCFFKKSLIEKYKYKKELSSSLQYVELIKHIILNTSKIRYMKRMCGYFYQEFMSQPSKLFNMEIERQEIDDCVKNNLQELIIYKIQKYNLKNVLSTENKISVSRRFHFKNIPLHYRVFYILSYNWKYKKYFQFNKI